MYSKEDLELKGERQKKLRDALLKAYPQKSSISKMLRDCSNYLDIDLNKVNQGNNHEEFVQNLIEEAKSRGQLRKLIIAASKDNPGNPALRNCVKALLPVLCDDIDWTLLVSLEVFNELIDILKIVENCETIRDCCVKTISNISDHRFQEMHDIQNKNLELTVKWLIVLGLLLKDYRQNQDGIPYIILFVYYLQDELKIQGMSSQYQVLYNWLMKVKPHYNYEQVIMKSNDISKQNYIEIQGYLSIFIKPQITSRKYLVNRFICIEIFQQKGANPSQVIFRDMTASSVDDTQANQQGILYDLQQIEDNILEWVQLAETELLDEANKLSCSSYDSLTIEFFLPYECLGKDVDRWKVYKTTPRLKKFTPIGAKHQVVVRSIDRLTDAHTFSQMQKMSQQVSENQAGIQHLDCLVGTDWEALTQETQQQVAITLSCAKPTCTMSGNTTDYWRNLFEFIVTNTTPIVLWSRQCNLYEVQSEMNRLLASEMLCNPNKLLQEVKKIRQAAIRNNNQHLGHHLIILWDEPQRLKQIRERLYKNLLWDMIK